jgi:hypothetical protein
LKEPETNRYLIKILDPATGYPTTMTIDKALPRLLSEKYPYFQPGRDGTGSGGVGGGDNTRPSVNGKILQGGNREPSDTELMAIMNDPKQMQNLFQELQRI